MLQNAYLDAKIGVDPAENEPPKECWVVAGHGEDIWEPARAHGVPAQPARGTPTARIAACKDRIEKMK